MALSALELLGVLFRSFFAVVFVSLLAACSFFGSVLQTRVSDTAPVVSNLKVQGDTKALHFSWEGVEDVAYYRVLRGLDEASNYAPISEELSPEATSFTQEDVAVHVLDWRSVRYKLEACNRQGLCGSSEPIGVSEVMLSTIGAFRSPTPIQSARFGHEVAMNAEGSVFAVAESEVLGSEGREGRVYVFRRGQEGWERDPSIIPPNQEAGEGIDFSLAMSGDGKRIALGAPRSSVFTQGINSSEQTPGGANRAGVVYVYKKESRDGAAEWELEALIRPEGVTLEDAVDDAFGGDVDLSADGTRLVVGSSFEDFGPERSGAVYVFRRDGGGWKEEASFAAPNAGGGDVFGAQVSIDNDGSTIAVSATEEDGRTTGVGGNQGDNSAADAGAIYTFLRSGETWTFDSYLKPSLEDDLGRFGVSLALSGDGSVLATSSLAELEDEARDASPGAVFLFERSRGLWSQRDRIEAPNPELIFWFGTSSLGLSEDGSLLAAGSVLERGSSIGVGGDTTQGDLRRSGAVFFYENGGASWELRTYIKATQTEELDAFGSSLALSADGSTLLVGASGKTSSSVSADDILSESGAVYLY